MIYFSKTNRNDEKRALRTLDSAGFIILLTPKTKKNTLFCSALDFSYLCPQIAKYVKQEPQ